MVRWYYRSAFDELEDLREFLEALDRQISVSSAGRLLPAARDPEPMMLPAYPAAFPVRVSETGDEVVVTAVMAAGTVKEEISLYLTGPLVLEITHAVPVGGEEADMTDLLLEWRSEPETQVVSLPQPVTKDGSSARFRDGVLEVRLKKTRQEAKGNIVIY